MLRRATPKDAAALEAFLARHAASSMFLRGNLEAHGTQELRHRHGTTFFVSEGSRGIAAVVGCTNGGFLMCQAADQDDAFWQEVCTHLKGRSIGGITGEPAQTGAWIAALGLQAEDFSINEITPLYQLDVAKVGAVDEALRLRAATPEDVEMLTQWYAGFHAGTGLTLAEGTTNKTIAQAFVQDPEGRILMTKGVPVAMTKLNARAVDAVQIGGVYVPPEHRGNGFGGDVVALHLAELAQCGVRQAVLFAASSYAARAYERIGFQRVGAYRVAMLRTPAVVGAAPAGLGLGER